ncbi:MAG: hypothetical protein DRN30_04245, partial [Thermoplasmata archaeon]
MASGFRQFVKGILLRVTSHDASHDVEGAVYVEDDSGNKVKAYVDGSKREVTTNDQTQELSNKTIDGTDASGSNTVSIDSTDAAYDNASSGLSATDAQGAID